MTPPDKPAFLAALSRTCRTVRQPMPDAEVLDVWWALLEPFAIDVVCAAFARHLAASRFAPTPADILALMPKHGADRPGADEAWAVALAARDERETVVWTAETAAAWHVASALVDSDEVGARMAFRGAYTRLVDEARAQGVPVRWSVSLGHDPERRAEAVNAAVRAGYLSVEDAGRSLPALAAPDMPGEPPDRPPDAQMLRNRERLRELVAGIAAAQERRLAARREAAARAEQETAARKREIDEQVQAYAQARGIRTREPGDDDEELPHEQRDR